MFDHSNENQTKTEDPVFNRWAEGSVQEGVSDVWGITQGTVIWNGR